MHLPAVGLALLIGIGLIDWRATHVGRKPSGKAPLVQSAIFLPAVVASRKRAATEGCGIVKRRRL